METLLKDIRFGIRSLLKRPGFTIVVVVTLAVGIGANTAIFSVVNAVLLRPLPYRASERIVTLWQDNVKSGDPRNYVSPANFIDWKEQSQSYEAMAGIEPFGFAMIGSGEPERLSTWLVTADFFKATGADALLGRTFVPEEYEAGNERVVVIGHRLWSSRFGGDRNIVGQKLTLNGAPYTVVGVMPPEFEFPPDRQVWAPKVLKESLRQLRGPTYWNVIARLKPGVTVAQAQSELSGIAARLASQYPDTNGEMGASVVLLSEQLTGKVRPALLILLGAVGFILLIACANVGNLLLIRSTERQREFAIRAALGAGRMRIVRQLLTESLMLALLGGAAGLLLASVAVRLILAFDTAKIPRLEQVGIDFSVLLFALGVSVLTAILFGLIPATQVSRLGLQSTLKEGSRGASAPRYRLRNALVVAEVAVALVLLTGAGLLVRSFVTLVRIDPGFDRDRVMALQVFLGRNYQSSEQINAFFDQSLEKITAVPGVEAAAVVASPPFIDLEMDAAFTVEGRPAPPQGSEPTAFYTEVSPDYLKVMSIPLRSGRFFSKFDNTGSLPVVVINETMARRYFPNEDPVGKKLIVNFQNRVSMEVIGVIGDVLHSGLDAERRPEMFVNYSQSPSSQMTFVVKTGPESTSMLAFVKSAIREVNPNQTFAKAATMDQLISDSLRQRRFNLFLLVSFAVVALVLAAIGIYGSINYSTRQRTHEIGVRIALGAQHGDVMRLIITQGLILTLTGVAIGLIASFALTRLMSGLLFGISATDPLTFVGISLLLTLIALLAMWIPARRATRVDPLVALRYE